jgi:hypothetical protein
MIRRRLKGKLDGARLGSSAVEKPFLRTQKSIPRVKNEFLTSHLMAGMGRKRTLAGLIFFDPSTANCGYFPSRAPVAQLDRARAF